GEDFIPESTWFQYIDEIVKVADKESYLMTRRLAREEAILAGSSSGAAVVAARRIAETLGPNDVLVVLLPDKGERYLSKADNEEWLKEQDRKSTRLNSSHEWISYAVFCLKKKRKKKTK